METKRMLRNRIAQLEKELENEKGQNRRSALVEKHDLPKCESMACASCAHIVYQRLPGYGTVLLGCGKDRKCKDFLPALDVVVTDEARLLLSQYLSER